MDEKGFVLTPDKEMVLVRRGEKAVYNRSKNNENECVTALLGGSAAGLQKPPMMIHSFKRMPASILQNNPENGVLGSQIVAGKRKRHFSITCVKFSTSFCSTTR